MSRALFNKENSVSVWLSSGVNSDRRVSAKPLISSAQFSEQLLYSKYGQIVRISPWKFCYLMLKNILYASDLGLYGPFILEHVCELACKHNAKVTVVHAVEPVSIFADALLETYVPQNEKEALKDHGYEAVMATISHRVRQAFEDDFIDLNGSKECIADVMVLDGDPSQVIMAVAKNIDADLIILGTHGGHSESRIAIGSVASKVMQLSHVPIYLVPTTPKEKSKAKFNIKRMRI